MSAAGSTREPNGSGRVFGELSLVGGLFAIVLIALAADAAAALLAHTRLLPPTAAIATLLRILRHPGDPGLRWRPAIPALDATAFWSLTAVLGLPPLALASALIVRFSGGQRDGLATAAEVRGEAGLRAARRLASSTRPSLSNRRLPAPEVGYPLGVRVAPRPRLGRPLRLICSWEHSLEVVAPPGAGKTLRVLAPILRQHPGPALATSTKADLYEVAAAARNRTGPVVALDPERLCPAAAPLRWSPVAGCEDLAVATRRASALVAAAGESGDVRAGAFFRRSAVAVLTSYLHAAALEGLSMIDVIAWAARPDDPAPLRILAEDRHAPVDWGARLEAHTSGAEETTSGVMRTVDLALGCFADEHVVAVCSPSSAEALDLSSFLDSRGTVFALGKDRGALGGTAPLVTAFCDELITVAEQRAAASPGRRLDPPLLCCLDEAPSIAPLPALPALLADGRGRGITTLVSLQSFSQAEARWGREGARTIRDAARVLVVFGGLSVAGDLEELSRLCGTRLTERGNSRGANRNWAPLVEEQVLPVAVLRSLGPGEALVLFDRLPPILARFTGSWEGRGNTARRDEERSARVANDAARAAPQRQSARETEPENTVQGGTR